MKNSVSHRSCEEMDMCKVSGKLLNLIATKSHIGRELMEVGAKRASLCYTSKWNIPTNTEKCVIVQYSY